MPSKPQTTNTVQSSQPWAPAQGALTDILGRAQSYGSDMSMWTPTQSAGTQGAISNINNFANGTNYGQQALETVGGGTQAAYNQGLGTLSNIANGAFMGPNPYLDQVNEYTAQNTADAVNRQFSGMGRYGSAAHTGELTRNLGQIYNQNGYNNYQTGLQNMQSAGNTLFSGGMQGAGQIGNLTNAALTPYDAQLKAGQIQDAYDQSVRQAPVNALNWENGVVGNMAKQYGSQTSNSQTTPSTNTFGQILGIGQMGLGLLGGIPAAGAGLSAAGGLFSSNSGGWTNPDTGMRYNGSSGLYNG